MSGKFTNDIEQIEEEVFTDAPQPKVQPKQENDIPKQNKASDSKFSNKAVVEPQFNNKDEIFTDVPQTTEQPQKKGKKSKKKNEDDYEIGELQVKAKGGFKVRYVVFGIIGFIAFIIILGAIKGKSGKQQNTTSTNQTPTSTEQNTEAQYSDTYKFYLTTLLSGKSKEFGFDFTGTKYASKTGEVITYIDLTDETNTINQSKYMDLTEQGRKDFLTDMLKISELLCSSGKLNPDYDNQLIDSIGQKDYINSTMYSGVLEQNNRNQSVDYDKESQYTVDIKKYDSVEKIYDENGSKCVIVDLSAKVTNEGSLILIVTFEAEGNVKKVPVKITDVVSLERSNQYDKIFDDGRIVGYGYSAKIDGLKANTKYQILAYTTSDRTEFTTIGNVEFKEK